MAGCGGEEWQQSLALSESSYSVVAALELMQLQHRAKWLARGGDQRLQCFGSWLDRLQVWDVFVEALCSHRMAVMSDPGAAVLCQGIQDPLQACRIVGSP